MTSSTQSPVKSGSEIVSEFVDSLQEVEALDPDTLASIRNLHKSGKLTKNTILRALEQVRSNDQQVKKPGDLEGQ